MFEDRAVRLTGNVIFSRSCADGLDASLLWAERWYFARGHSNYEAKNAVLKDEVFGARLPEAGVVLIHTPG